MLSAAMAIEMAMIDSTSLDESEIAPRAARLSVIVCAIVKIVTTLMT